MNSLEAMCGCGLNFFIKLAYNSLFLYKFARKVLPYPVTILIMATLEHTRSGSSCLMKTMGIALHSTVNVRHHT